MKLSKSGIFLIVVLVLAIGLGAWVTVVQGLVFVVCVLAFRRGLVGELAYWIKKPL